MARNLDPRLVAFEARLERGAILRLQPPEGGAADALAGNVLRFQYNPETLTRTRTGRWEPRKKRRGLEVASPQEVTNRSGQGSSALLAESEQITLRITFDATEAVLAGRPDAAERGVLPELAFLEVLSTGKEGHKANRERESVQPIRPDELLLVLGRSRMFPVVLTNLTVTEQKFLPTLVPLRAEVELRCNVLEPVESSYTRWIDAAFGRLLEDRRQAAAVAAESSDVAAAIARELEAGGGS